jgi:hypothetical protein
VAQSPLPRVSRRQHALYAYLAQEYLISTNSATGKLDFKYFSFFRWYMVPLNI